LAIKTEEPGNWCGELHAEKISGDRESGLIFLVVLRFSFVSQSWLMLRFLLYLPAKSIILCSPDKEGKLHPH